MRSPPLRRKTFCEKHDLVQSGKSSLTSWPDVKLIPQTNKQTMVIMPGVEYWYASTTPRFTEMDSFFANVIAYHVALFIHLFLKDMAAHATLIFFRHGMLLLRKLSTSTVMFQAQGINIESFGTTQSQSAVNDCLHNAKPGYAWTKLSSCCEL